MVQTSESPEPSMDSFLQRGRIIVGGYPKEGVGQVAKLLKKLSPRSKSGELGLKGAEFSKRLLVPAEPQDPQLLRAKLDADDRNILMVFIENPASAFARALTEGRSLSEAAEAWGVAATRLLNIPDRSGRVRIYALDEVVALPGDFTELVSHDFGVELSVAEELGHRQRKRLQDFYLMIALHYIHEHPDLASLASSLEQRRQFRPVSRPGIESDWSRALEDVNTIREENTIMFEQLHKLQIDYEYNLFRLSESEEIDISLANKPADVAELKKKLDAVYASTSWRITRPIRAVSYIVKRLVGR